MHSLVNRPGSSCSVVVICDSEVQGFVLVVVVAWSGGFVGAAQVVSVRLVVLVFVCFFGFIVVVCVVCVVVVVRDVFVVFVVVV